jgi:hypothetical protein
MSSEPPQTKDTNAFVRETGSPQTQSERIKRKRRRGKHSRYVAAQGKNGEPDKTHIDVLVKVIQTSEMMKKSPEPTTSFTPSLSPEVEDPLSSQNALPSIETLQLDADTNPIPPSEERELLDGMAGIPSTNDQSTNNGPFNSYVFDFFPEWDIVIPGQSTSPTSRYHPTQWSQDSPPDSAAPLSPTRGRTTSIAERKVDKGKAVIAAKPISKSLLSCPYPGCTAKFHLAHQLKVHNDSHREVKPFKCTFDGCDKMFSQKGNLKVLVWKLRLTGRHIKDDIRERNHLCVKIVTGHLRKKGICKLI